MAIPAKARNVLAVVFIAFLLVNAVVLTMTMIALRNDDPSLLPPNLGDDVAIGLRLVLVLVGAAFSWFCAQLLYKQLVTGFVSPSDACSTSCSLMSYLVLVVAAVAFLGAGVWLWLPLLFVIILCWSTISIWKFVGSGVTVASLVLVTGAVVATWLLLS